MKRYLAIIAILFVLPATSQAYYGGVGRPIHPATTLNGNLTKARMLPNGNLLPPPLAPRKVKEVVRSANRINDTSYVWGGGHGSFHSSGYDCSGSVSYALHGGGFVRKPMVSEALASWGKAGHGQWITVYANSGHVYAEIAGYRWDTVGGPGPRWHKAPASHAGFATRHPKGF
jgi:hypothetical protein